MQTARPAPLLPVAFAFGGGCLAGLKSTAPSPLWLALALVCAAAWLALFRLSGRNPKIPATLPILALLAFAAMAGAFHGSLRETLARPGDLRLLPPEKFSARTQWRGEVTGDPRFRPRANRDDSGRVTLVLQISGWRRSGEEAWQPAHGLLQAQINNTSPDSYHYGDTLEIIAGLQKPSQPRNPGQFDVAAYLTQRDIYYEAQINTPDAAQKISSGGGDAATMLAWRARDWALGKLRLGIEDDPVASSLLAGMLLGYVEQVPGHIETDFRNTGTYHIFAVSGQNVAVILGVGLVALQLLGFVRWRWGWVMVPVLVFYCLITGGQPSAVRALLMAILVLGAWWCERPISTLNLWSLALLAVMAYDPKLITNLSFQLSFAVVGAIILITPPLYNGLCRRLRLGNGDEESLPGQMISPWRRRMETAMRAVLLLASTSVAAWIGSLPLMAWYFHQVTLIGLVANLFVVPLAGWIVVVGTIALALAPVSSALTATVNNANWLLVKGLVWFVAAFAQVPGGCFFVPDPTVDWRPAEPEFICAQTGGTTTMLIRHGDKSWLVNTGTESQFKYVTNPLRKFYGVNRCEAVILTELSGSEAGGATLLANENIVTRWIIPPSQKISPVLKSWQTAVAEKSTPQVWTRGHTETLAPGFTVTALAPDEDNRAARAEDRGMALLFQYKNRTLLYAGRIGPAVETEILKRFASVHADVLVQGPHGAQPNMETSWLKAVRPLEVIISASTAYGNERLESFDLLPAALQPKVWHQDDAGAVTVRLGEKGIEITPFCK